VLDGALRGFGALGHSKRVIRNYATTPLF
jgi:hypothetical protein